MTKIEVKVANTKVSYLDQAAIKMSSMWLLKLYFWQFEIIWPDNNKCQINYLKSSHLSYDLTFIVIRFENNTLIIGKASNRSLSWCYSSWSAGFFFQLFELLVEPFLLLSAFFKFSFEFLVPSPVVGSMFLQDIDPGWATFGSLQLFYGSFQPPLNAPAWFQIWSKGGRKYRW